MERLRTLGAGRRGSDSRCGSKSSRGCDAPRPPSSGGRGGWPGVAPGYCWVSVGDETGARLGLKHRCFQGRLDLPGRPVHPDFLLGQAPPALSFQLSDCRSGSVALRLSGLPHSWKSPPGDVVDACSGSRASLVGRALALLTLAMQSPAQLKTSARGQDFPAVQERAALIGSPRTTELRRLETVST